MLNIDDIDWEKGAELVPAVVQDAFDGRVLMVGYMNRDALAATLKSGRVTFWSRSREALWTKGETSGNTLSLVGAHADCDRDCILVRARPAGPSCHRGTDTCFDGGRLGDGAGAEPADGEAPARAAPDLGFLATLDRLVAERQRDRPEGSYTTRLFEAGVQRVAQKVGEEGVETALAAAAGSRGKLLDESADLLYHLLVLLRSRDAGLEDLVARLASRHG